MIEIGDKVELDGRMVEVLEIDTEFPSVISTPEGDFLPIRFKVKEIEGGGTVHWTCSFADHSRPVE